MKHQLPQLQHSLQAYFGAQADVELAYLFGSQASGRAGPLSDVDVAVLLRGQPSQEVQTERTLDFSGDIVRLLHRDDVDVVVLNRAPVALKYQVVRDGILLYCTSRNAADGFRVMTQNAYFDFRPLLEYHRRAFFVRIENGGMLDGYDRHRGAIAADRRRRAGAQGATATALR